MGICIYSYAHVCVSAYIKHPSVDFSFITVALALFIELIIEATVIPERIIVVERGTVQSDAVRYFMVQLGAARYSAAHSGVMHCAAMQCGIYDIILLCVVFYCVVLCCDASFF